MTNNAPTNHWITSREYKVMLDARMFDMPSAKKEFSQDLLDCIELHSEVKGKHEPFSLAKTHRIRFLETETNFFNSNQLLLRERRIVGKKTWELTLKSRSPDYYTGFRIDLTSPESKEPPKFEEDIGAPFVSKFSQSMTLSLKGDVPRDLKNVSNYFPVVESLPGYERQFQLASVNQLEMMESVYQGPTIELNSTQAEFALILWKRRDKGRTSVAECSFRYKVKKGDIDRSTSIAFASLYSAIQRLEWCSTESQTKTQYMYQTNR